MPKSFQLPDGSIIEGINDKYSDEEIRAKAMRKFPELYARELEEQKGFIPSFKRSFKESASHLLPESLSGIKILAGAQPDKENQEEPLVPPQSIARLREEPSWSGIKQYLGETLGGATPQVAAPLAVAGTAALGGAPAVIGGGLAALSMAPGIAHQIYQRGLEGGKSKEEATSAARLGAPLEAALYGTPVGRVGAKLFGKTAFKDLSDAEIKRLSEQGILRSAGKSAAVEAPIAAGVGAANEGITQGLLDEKMDPSRMLESAVPMGILGAIGGSFGGNRGAAIGERGRRQRLFEEAYPVKSKQEIETLQKQRTQAEAEHEGIEGDFETAEAARTAEEQKQKQQRALLLSGHEPYGHKLGFELTSGDENAAPIAKEMPTLGNLSLSKEQNIFATLAENPRTELIQHDQGLESVPFHQGVAAARSIIKPVFAEDLPVKAPSDGAVIAKALHDAYLTTRGEKPGEHSYKYYLGQLKGATTPESIIRRIEGLIAKTKDQAKQETLTAWKENLEAKGYKGAENADRIKPIGTAGDTEAVTGRSKSGVGVPALEEGSSPKSEISDATRLGAVGPTTGERVGGEGAVEHPLTKIHEADYDAENVKKTIGESQKFLTEEEAKRKASGETFKEEEKTLTPEEIEADNQDKSKIAIATTEKDNPLGKYIRDTGNVDAALQEIAFHRAWGMNEGRNERNSRGVGWTKGEGQLSQPYKEVSPHTASNAEKWINKNLSERGKDKYRKFADEEKNLKASYMKSASHGPSEREGKARGPYKIFKEDSANVRQMTRALRGKLDELNDVIERAGNLLHAGDETTARTRAEQWLEKNKNIVPDLRKFLGLRGKESLVEELLDRSLERNHIEHVLSRGDSIPLSPRNRVLAENGHLLKILDNLAEQGSSLLSRVIADRFREFAPDTKLKIANFQELSERYQNVLPNGRGAYLPENNIIYLNSDPKHSGFNEHAFLHEVAHALTNTIMKAVNDRDLGHLSTSQKQAYYALNNVYRHLKDRHQKDGYKYGFDNFKEFVAEAFSNPQFQEFLHRQPINPKSEGFGSGLRNLWDKFVSLISRIWGTDNALGKTLELSNILLTKPRPEWFDRGEVEHLHTYDELLSGDKAPQEHGFFGKAVRKGDELKHTPMTAIGSAIHDAMVWLERTGFNQRYGITRFMPSSTFLPDGKLNPAALIQRQEYATQIGGASLTAGYVGFTEKGMPIVKVDSENNMGTLMQGISALPESFGADKVHAFNRIASNLTYAERLANAQINKDNANKVIEQAREKLKDAQTMTGATAARTITNAKRALKEAKQILKREDFAKPDYITKESMEQAQEAAKLPEVQKVLDIVHSMNMHDIDFYEQTGMIDKEVADQWRTNKYYVNLGRVMEDVERSAVMRGAGRMVNLRTLKEFEGSERPVDDILGNIIRQRLFMTDAGIRNQASVAAIKYLQEDGHGGIEKMAGKPINKTNVIQVWEDGQRTYYGVEDKNAFKSFQGLQEQAPMWMDSLESVTALFREAITLTPPFIARNMFKDSTGAWAMGYTGANLFTVWGKVAGQFAASMPKIAKEITKGGVHVPEHEVSMFGISGSREMTSLIREKESVLRKALTAEFGATQPKDWADKVDRTLSVAHHLMQNLTGESELATRERVYQDVKRRTGSPEEGIMAATNVLDFRMRGAGSAITYAKKLIPFFNSNLQGWYTIYRALKNRLPGIEPEQGRKMLANRLMAMAAATSAYAMLMSGDKDYQEAKKQTSDNAWLLPVGDGAFLKLPIPYEIGFIAKVVPENLIRTMNGDQSGRQFTDALGQALFNQLPNGAPQVVKPVVEVATNHDFFTGKPIESATQTRKMGSERYTDATSDTAKALGGDKLSPMMVDHLLQGYFGSVGTFLTTAVLDPLFEADHGKGAKPTKALEEKAGVRAFLTNPTQSRSMDMLYELRDLTSKPKATYDEMIKEGRGEEAKKFADAKSETGKPNSEMMALNTTVSNITGQLAQLRGAQKQIAADSKLSADDKAERIKKIKMQMREISSQVMEVLRPLSGI